MIDNLEIEELSIDKDKFLTGLSLHRTERFGLLRVSWITSRVSVQHFTFTATL